jgi:tetratricopeptide (TPR) repeat protein
MKFPTFRVAIPLAVAIVLAVGSGWWVFRTRPTLEGVVNLIAAGRYKAAEGRLGDYLAAYPGDELGRLMLAKVLVDRAEADPGAALRLLDGLRPADPHRASLARAIEGDAHFWAGHYDHAEVAWLESLRLEPTRPEVGWKLLNIYALQGRDDDSSRLAIRLFALETDERDRVQLLLQLIRHDAHSIEAGSVVYELDPIVRANPGDLRSTTALALALLRVGRADEGMDLLRRSARSHPDDLGARLALVDGLMATGGVEELAEVLSTVPSSMADSPRLDAARGWLAAQGRDLDGATRAYKKALDRWPPGQSLAHSTLAYRLKNVLRQADRAAVLAEIGPHLEEIVKFPVVVRDFFDRLNGMPDLGLDSHPEEYDKLAAVLARVGRQEEADAWTLLARRHRRGTP